MSAMHWEARRRQSALERRAAHRNQLLEENTAPSDSHSVSGVSTSAESTVGEQCPHCKSTLKTPDGAAKIPNRYSSLQYKQQW